MEKEKLLQDLEYEFICNFVMLRRDKGLSQKGLAEMSGVVREQIAKIETQLNSPQLNSLIKILEPIGYTVKIVPISGDDNGLY